MWQTERLYCSVATGWWVVSRFQLNGGMKWTLQTRQLSGNTRSQGGAPNLKEALGIPRPAAEIIGGPVITSERLLGQILRYFR